MPYKKPDPRVKKNKVQSSKAKVDSKQRQAWESPKNIVDRLTIKLKKEFNTRKRVEEALCKSLDINRSLASLDSMFIVDRECRYQFMNEKQLSRLGLSLDEIAGKSYGDFHSKESTLVFANNVEKAFNTGASIRTDFRSPRDNKYFIRSYTPVTGTKKNIRFVTVVSTDISELKQSEENNRALVKEKDALLREIHHRVKNNMQVISSVLNLQTSEFKSPEIVAVLKESQRRIHTMAIVHEQLYNSTSLDEIKFNDYIETLTAHISQALKTDPSKVRFQFNLEPLSLNISSAIPCGMIISELISNCLRHAFPDDRAGIITVEFHRKKDNGARLELIVRDDGVGLLPGIDIGVAGTLGLEVVRILTEQLNGSIKLERDGGTTFRIEFEEPLYKPRI